MKLKGELLGLNEMITDMLDKKNEVLNEYESIVRQKKGYKKLMKSLQEEYESYQSMLQGNYHIKLEEEL
jgi:dsDNA-specific endonuclease/ATPase MutS2